MRKTHLWVPLLYGVMTACGIRDQRTVNTTRKFPEKKKAPKFACLRCWKIRERAYEKQEEDREG